MLSSLEISTCTESSYLPANGCIHNPTYKQIMEVTRNIPSEGLSILLLKPGFFPIDDLGRPLQRHIEGLIRLSQLEVVATACSILSKDDVWDLYDDLFGPAVTPISPALSRVRVDLEQYMTSDCVFWYLVAGRRAAQKTKALKYTIRESYGYVKGSKYQEMVEFLKQKSGLDEIFI